MKSPLEQRLGRMGEVDAGRLLTSRPRTSRDWTNCRQWALFLAL
ncbi:MAG TPA: hypothetical protein VKK19_08585 [Candidatus Dormibacteraeota bacterium]|nr:hypothetical protein [Candidatus Dormibacteraeota bacterium]